MRYGEDADPPRRIRKVEDFHAQEVMLRAAIMEEYKSVFNVASMLADELAKLAPDHPYVYVAKFEGMLGRFEMKPKESDAIPIEEQSPSVQTMYEGGVLPVSCPEWDINTGAGAILDSKAPSVGDSVAQGGGSPDAQADGDGGSSYRSGGIEQISFGWGSGEALAGGSVSGVGESSE